MTAGSWRTSASLIVAAERAGVIRVLMGQRGTTQRFMPNAWVFPGGTVDKADVNNRNLWQCERLVCLPCSLANTFRRSQFLQNDTATPQLPAYVELAQQHAISVDEARRATRLCALRELYEEMGVLLLWNRQKGKLLAASIGDEQHGEY